jgi:hypothetical protein
MPWLVTGITSRFLAGLLVPRFLFALVFVHTVLWLVLVLPILSRALAEVLRAKSPFGTGSGGQVPEDLPVLWPMEAFPNTLGYSYTLRPSSWYKDIRGLELFLEFSRQFGVKGHS